MKQHQDTGERAPADFRDLHRFHNLSTYRNILLRDTHTSEVVRYNEAKERRANRLRRNRERSTRHAN